MTKSVHVTISLPKEVKDWLYNSVEKGSISQFVSECIKISLHDKESVLAQAYQEAALDQGQLEGRKDWAQMENEDFLNMEWYNE